MNYHKCTYFFPKQAVLSNKIKETVLEHKNKKESIRRVDKLLYCAVSKTGNNWQKISTTSSKVIITLKKSKHGFEPKLYESMVDFYEKGDNSTALPGKSDA